jgi:hypothetical protein
LVTARAWAMNSSATGPSVRSLSVTTTTGSGLPSVTGSAHSDQRSAL